MNQRVCVVCMALLLPLALGSCGRQEARKEITETRPAAAPSESEKSAKPEMPGNPHGEAKQAFTWTTPEGWTAVPSTPMRAVNFEVGPAPAAECYVSVLRGLGGGTEMNINRWRGQMGVTGASLTPEAIGQLPKITVLGTQVPLLEVPGEYRGMSDKPQAGYMLLGTVCEMEPESVFVKMIGPESTVRANRDKFVAFCESLKR